MGENVLPPKENNGSAQKSGKQKEKNSKRVEGPKKFNIQEVETFQNDLEGEKGGVIDLGKPLDPVERLERWEKLRTRKFLTYSIVPFSIIWVLVGIIHYLLSGDSFLLRASSPMSGPILIIMGYYFGDQLLQKYLHRGP
jgi:hypothetical protein